MWKRLPSGSSSITARWHIIAPAVDIAILKTCPMDEGGYFNFGPTNMWRRAVVERAKLVVVEINREMPYVFGKENGVHVCEVDFILEGDDQQCTELPNPEPDEIDRTVARRIAAELEDGCCLQIGIGGMPNPVCCTASTGDCTGVRGRVSFHLCPGLRRAKRSCRQQQSALSD
jgi:acyl-CoA hydrolase